MVKDGSAKVNDMDLHRYKQLLLAKRRELTAATSECRGLAQAADDTRRDLMDRASGETEVKVRIRLRQTEGHLARAIEEALDRIERRTFGVCEACKHPIALARLNAVPWTRLCRGCKEHRHFAA
jgi:DnaK suppressor protein